MDENDERVYMIFGTDQLGDQHVFATCDETRALLAYRDFASRYEVVRGNEAIYNAALSKVGHAT
ncbi:hypothetical protein [Novosphingobium sp. JCM 18896]|uniref:hypothetical protein n=1 Tax=Novosphingobium sp. JCM 18896 TaxID=2989731 RepID=UPI002221F23B|nr:hypothetical protein [Novosphingobium sp. JCM 18896]MCW1432117.1 hypothetical protein [Novosphingobium sp. JCM 18896]